MNSRHNRQNTVLVDKQLIAVNYEELNFLQTCMLFPKPYNITALKKRFGIPLTVHELILELQDKNSPIHRYFQSLIICQIARILLAQQEENRKTLQNVEAKQRHQAEVLLLDELEREQIREYLMALREGVKLETYLGSLGLGLPKNVIVSMEEAKTLRSFFLESLRKRELEYYLPLITDKKKLQRVLEILDELHGMRMKNDERMRRIDAKEMTPEEREAWEIVKENYALHEQYSAPEKIAKYVTHLPDDVDVEQKLKRLKLDEEFFGRNFELHEGNQSEIFLLDRKNNLNETKVNRFPSDTQSKSSWMYSVFSDKICKALDQYTTNEDNVVLVGYEEIYNLLRLLNQAITKKVDASLQTQINLQVILLRKLLLEEGNEKAQGIIESLQTWSEKHQLEMKTNLDDNEVVGAEIQNLPEVPCGEIVSNTNAVTPIGESSSTTYISEEEKEAYLNLIQILRALEKQEDQAKPLLISLRESLEHVNEENKSQIIENYKMLVKNFPYASFLEQIYYELVAFSFINPDELPEPAIGTNRNLGAK